MKKLVLIFVLACTFSATVKADAINVRSNVNAFVQPFSQSYALTSSYWWFTDIDLTDFTGSVRDIWTEMDRLRSIFSGYSFSHVAYAGLNEFEYGYCAPLYYATIYSDLPQ